MSKQFIKDTDDLLFKIYVENPELKVSHAASDELKRRVKKARQLKNKRIKNVVDTTTAVALSTALDRSHEYVTVVLQSIHGVL